jgi:hypothetical protein
VELSFLTPRRIPSLAQFEETHSFDALIIGAGFSADEASPLAVPKGE